MGQLRFLDIDERNRPEIERVLGPILATIDWPELVLSRACTYVLLQSVAALYLKRAEVDVLSSSTITFVTLSLARRMARAGSSGLAVGNRIGDETDRLRAWGRVFESSYGNHLDALIGEFFVEPPNPEPDDYDLMAIPEGVSANCSTRLAINLAALAAEGGVVRIDSLVLRLLNDPETQIAQRVNTPNSEGIAEALQEATATLAGRSPSMAREADPTELALRVEEYALALATVLRTAKGEFTFALLGPWGSGKTTLTKVMKRLLEDPQIFRDSAGTGEEAFASRRYVVVVHNAWKYRSRPECWIFAYRSLAEAAMSSCGAIGSVLMALRVSVLRKGPWPLTAAPLSLAALAFPFSARLQLAVLAFSTVGFSVALYLALVSTRGTSRVRELFMQHLRLSSVDEKLGMLALVGDDIRALVAAWTRRRVDDPDDDKSEGPPWTRLAFPLCVLSMVGVGWLVGVLGWWSFNHGTVLANLNLSFLPEAWVEAFAEFLSTPRHEFPLAELGVLVAWTMLAAFLMVLPWLVHAGRPNRVLMIVDDLDRCSPSEMLDVIEGMRLLLDDEEVNRRLQILILADETVLNHGIGLRYDTLIRERAAEAGNTDKAAALRLARDEVIAEQNEKLFACHLRVAGLTNADVEALVSSLAGAELAALKRTRLEQQEARRQKQLQEAAAALQQASERRQAADAQVRSARNFRPLPLKEKDAPADKQPPMHTRIRLTGGDPFPPTAEEVRRREAQNEKIRALNAAQERKTPEERQAEQLAAERERDKAEFDEREAKRQVDMLSVSRSASQGVGPQREAAFDRDDVRFTAVEVEQLQRLVPAYLNQIGRRPSPRAIRILLFKIQLCRLLLYLRYPWHPRRIRSIDAILAAFSAASKPPAGDGAPEDETTRIARQVV
jgi:energy-coupling factor transporter ATP-binding protein EcfA2